MKILNYDVKDEQSDYKQKVPFMPESKYEHLVNRFDPISEEADYPIIEATSDKIIPLDTMPCDNQKLVIFDDYLNTGVKNDAEIRNYFTNSRNKNCSCTVSIYAKSIMVLMRRSD